MYSEPDCSTEFPPAATEIEISHVVNKEHIVVAAGRAGE